MGRKGTWEIQGTICRYISSGLVDQPARKVQPLNQRIARASHGQGAFRDKKKPFQSRSAHLVGFAGCVCTHTCIVARSCKVNQAIKVNSQLGRSVVQSTGQLVSEVDR